MEQLLSYQEERRKARLAVREFVASAAAGDVERMAATFGTLDFFHYAGGGWDHAMRAVARLDSVPDRTREFFLRVHIRYGDHIRQECINDLTLVGGYRALLPPYIGPAITLYRGEQGENRRRRTYGMSWTARREVAEAFAQGMSCVGHKSGGVLLKTLAGPEAIICAVPDDVDRYDEQEYLVDRRQLRQVKVLARYPHQERQPLSRTG